MSRRTIRRQLNLKSSGKNTGTGTENLEEYGSDNNCDANIVTDLAKGFAQAQANSSNAADNQAIMDLLQKVNSQLEMLQSSQGSDQNQQQATILSSQSNQAQQSGQQQQAKEQQQSDQNSEVDNQATQDLKNLFSQILTKADNQSQKSQSDSGSKTQSSKQSDKTSALAVQTASQVLAKAQYELANELETSLEKLKQVISESEKIANQISNLLGESSNKKS
ncbi:hypothetical protein SDC9_83586 [bioreactor metagenome]|uniref:Uncharacterized protein n=1 Tax=bioreactor metagenome TaxID=1076179 RepID=A0A644Z862_9ZZZZ